jgi:hypothetical protein
MFVEYFALTITTPLIWVPVVFPLPGADGGVVTTTGVVRVCVGDFEAVRTS